MRHEKLFEPVDSAEPCGPDLDEIGDEDYLNYVLPAEDRLPASFFDKTGAPVDRSGIDLKAEVKAISALLEKSRDLRLLALEARFQVSAGQFVGFSECIQAIAGLVSRFWNDIHPIGFDGDYTLRQNTLASLDDRGKIILPLQFASIVRDKKLGNISYRHYAVATGQVQPRADEPKLDPADIVEAFTQESNRQAVETVHAALMLVQDGLNSTRASFIDAAGYEYAPNFDTLIETIGQIAGLIEKGLPALSKTPHQTEPETDGAATSADAAAPDGGKSSPAPVKMQELPAVPVASQQEASAALLVAEDYFSVAEPSAPSLILVRQARLLIGKPLVAALEALVPQTADQALIRFDGGVKFQIDMNRMRLLSGDPPQVEPKAGRSGTPQTFTATSRAEASALIAGVERYFRTAEPSSPVPMLLTKARSFMNQDFLAILNSLIGTEEQAV